MDKAENVESYACSKKSFSFGIGCILFRGQIVILTFLFFCVSNFAIETEDNELLASFDAAREAWLQNVSFYGNYTFKQTGFYSEAEAQTKSIAEKYTVARGIICKLKDKYRMQAFYIKKPEVVSKSGAVSGRSIDTIANKNFHAHFYPEQGDDFLAEGALLKRSTYTISNIVSHLDTFNTPFALFLAPITEISPSVSREPKYTITQLDNDRELLSFTGKSISGNIYAQEVTIRTSEKIPVIEQITLHRFGNEGSDKPLSSGTTKVLEWKICEGISVPSVIRAVAGPLKPINSDKDTWVVSEWRSDDIGNRSPTDKDFILQLPPDVGLAGMNHYPKGGLVDIDKITDADFLPSGSKYFRQETLPVLEPDTVRYNVLRWTFMAVGIILIVWGLVQAYRKKK